MPQIANFDQARTKLFEYIPDKKHTGKYSLGRMKSLMSFLDNPQDSYKTVHVAGTSGKTSTSYYIATLLRQSGKKVGLTVSPHIDEINERVQINLLPLAEKEYCAELNKFMQKIDKFGEKPTYFELLVAFAYWEFARQRVDYAVIEVGLGGLMDGTNVIHRPDKVCVICDIGLDHTSVLGNTIGEIATQKAGIIQEHNSVFMYWQSDEVMAAVYDKAKQKHAQLYVVDPKTENFDLPPFQQRNFGLAKEIYEFTAERDKLNKLSIEQITEATRVMIPARMEIFKHEGKTIIIDGSHNEQKMAALINGVRTKYPNQPMAALVSFGHNKKEILKSTLSLLTPEVKYLFVTKFDLGQDEIRQPIDPAKIAKLCRQTGFNEVTTIDDPEEAFKQLLARPEKVLLVTGSFYLLNHIRPILV